MDSGFSILDWVEPRLRGIGRLEFKLQLASDKLKLELQTRLVAHEQVGQMTHPTR
jgi:hypothetical protein